MQDTEIFLPIKGFEGIYEISNHGTIKSLSRRCASGKIRKERIIKPSNSTRGYKVVGLRPYNSIRYNTSIHRLVAAAFVENPNNYKEVNHIDGVKTNNHFSNLEWCSRSQNVKHSYDNKLLIPKIGMQQKNAKLTDEMVLRSLKMRNVDAAKEFNVHETTIERIKNGKSWSHVTGIVKQK